MKNIICWIHGSLEQMGLQELVNRYTGYFIVNYDVYEVIYSEGYRNENGMWCYKISDLYKKPENKIINKVESNQEEQSATDGSEESQNNEGVQENTEGGEENKVENEE